MKIVAKTIALAKEIREYARDFLVWFMGPWLVWAAILGTIALFVLFGATRPCDLAYRVVGLLTQLGGAAIAVTGVLQLRLDFDLKPYRALWKEWWASRPRWRKKFVGISGSVGSVLAGVLSNAVGKVNYDRTRPLHEQVDTLTTAMEAVHRTIAAIDKTHTERANALESQLKEVAKQLAEQHKTAVEKVKGAHTAGAPLTLLGAALLILGAFLTSVPGELAALFGSMKPICDPLAIWK